MTHEEIAKELIDRGSKFTFSSNSYNEGDTQKSQPSVEMSVWLKEAKEFIIGTYKVGSIPYSQLSAFDRERLMHNSAETFDSKLAHMLSILETTLFIKPKDEMDKSYTESLVLLKNLFEKFHLVVGQLHSSKSKYRIHEIFHALLRLYFNDILVEERNDRFGEAAYGDFLLTDEEIILVLKEISDKYDENKFIEEMASDIVKYKNHAGCNYMICFVFDPDHQVKDPERLTSGLNTQDGGFKVEVVIK